MDNETEKIKSKFYKKWWFWAPIVLLFLIIITPSGNQQQKVNEKKEIIKTEEAQEKEASEKVIENKENTNPNQEQITNLETAKISEDSQIKSKEIQAKEKTEYEYYSVISVTDGDTLKINMDGKTETLRLIGIDTPETVDPRKTVQCFGKEASNKAKEMLTGKKVRVEKDSTQGERDKYNRLLVYIYLEDGLFYNKYIIEQGYAHEYTYNIPYKHQVDFKNAQKSAQNNQRGLWNPNTCNGVTTSAPKTTTPPTTKTEKSEVVKVTGHTYYLSSYHTAVFYYCDTDEVWKGLSPKYLKSYSSEQELLKNYPSRQLHEACR